MNKTGSTFKHIETIPSPSIEDFEPKSPKTFELQEKDFPLLNSTTNHDRTKSTDDSLSFVNWNNLKTRFGPGTAVPAPTSKFTSPSRRMLPLCKAPKSPLPSVRSSTTPSKHQVEQTMSLADRSTAPKHILKPGEDSFDPLEWSSDLPSTAASPDHSPEPVPIKLQPLAYTTVGSVVNPNVVPQFSAPNRIQREGANRRPLHTLLGTPRYEPMVQTRTASSSLPPLNMANSMHYAQQIARSPVQVTPSPSSTTSTSGHSSRPIISNMPGPLGKLEEMALIRNLLRNELQETSGNVMERTGSPTVSKKHTSSATLPSGGIYTIKELSDDHNRSNSMSGSVQGLEKMQTLQRLAKFENPMQQFAIDRLSEFLVGKSENTGNTSGLTLHEMLLQSQIGMSKSSASSNNTGELDLGYQFPPPGLAPPSTAQFNQSLARNLTQPTPAPARPGYPEPLRAGPPGQRQFPSQHPTSTSYSELWGDYGTQSYNPYGNTATASHWGTGYNNQPPAQPEFFPAHSGHVKSKVVDTIDPTAAAKYYTNGYPTDMNVWHQPLSEEDDRLMEEGPANLLPKAVKDARRDAKTNNLLSEGQRRYNLMNADDYYKELADLKSYNEVKKENPYGVIRPPKKKQLPPVEPKPITEEEIKKKSVPELVAPILEATWGVMAGYKLVDCPGSNNDLSKFAASPEWQIDSEAEGNTSFFGEDWGKPLQRSRVEANSGWEV